MVLKGLLVGHRGGLDVPVINVGKMGSVRAGKLRSGEQFERGCPCHAREGVKSEL